MNERINEVIEKKSYNLIQKHQPVIPENQLINKVRIPTTSVARTSSKTYAFHKSNIIHDYKYMYTA